MSETSAPRAIHRRTIEHQSWMHEDDSLEIEGRLIDTKAYDCLVGFNRALPAGEPVHDMTIRILLGRDWRIRDIRLHMAHTPFDICPEIVRRFEDLKGASMGKGWNALLSERFSGTGGCRHLIDLLRGMATVAFQSMPRPAWTKESVEWLAGSCHAFRQGGPVMKGLVAELAKTENQLDE